MPCLLKTSLNIQPHASCTFDSTGRLNRARYMYLHMNAINFQCGILWLTFGRISFSWLDELPLSLPFFSFTIHCTQQKVAALLEEKLLQQNLSIHKAILGMICFLLFWGGGGGVDGQYGDLGRDYRAAVCKRAPEIGFLLLLIYT